MFQQIIIHLEKANIIILYINLFHFFSFELNFEYLFFSEFNKNDILQI